MEQHNQARSMQMYQSDSLRYRHQLLDATCSQLERANHQGQNYDWSEVGWQTIRGRKERKQYTKKTSMASKDILAKRWDLDFESDMQLNSVNASKIRSVLLKALDASACQGPVLA